MKKINPVIANVIAQRTVIASNIKMAELGIEKDKANLAEIDGYFANDPGYKRFIDLAGLEGHELLKATINFFSVIFDKLAEMLPAEDDRMRNAVNFINHLHQIEANYSDELAIKQNVWSACMNHLGYLNIEIMEQTDIDEWTYRGLQQAINFAQSNLAIKAQLNTVGVLSPSLRQNVNYSGYRNGGLVMGNGMGPGGPAYAGGPGTGNHDTW